MSQSNVQAGDVVRFPYNNVGGPSPATGLDLSGRMFMHRAFTGGDNTKQVVPVLSSAVLPQFVSVDGQWGDAHFTVRPLSPHQPIRVRLKGACHAGDQIEVADSSSWTDAGYVQAYDDSVPGDHALFGVAEEAGVDGQLLLVRPINPRIVTIAGP